jgi:EgtB-related family protein
MRDPFQRYSAAHRLRAGSRDDVRAGLLAERARTLAIAEVYLDALGPSLAVPYDAGLNPPAWEWGHIAWFQEWWTTRNAQRGLGVRCDPERPRPLPSLERADEWFDSSRVGHRTRWGADVPAWPAVRDWMDLTFSSMLEQLEALPADAGDDDLYFFRLACLHEAMHAEAACYMARTLGFFVPGGSFAPTDSEGALEIPAQSFELGSAGPGFSFDNELGAHAVRLEAFQIDAAPVTWDAFGAFVSDGGFAQRRWWSEPGWQWIQKERHQPPRLPLGQGPAVHLSCHEAEAWCNWAGRRLPTEAEWECAAVTRPDFSWGRVWEWTATPFAPYPGFEAHPYRDYSQPWFHTRRVLRGACDATSPRMAHPRYRNFFEPHRSDIFAGFRSCSAAPG